MFDVNSKIGSGAMPAATGVTPPLQPTNPAYNTYVGARYVPVFSEQPGALWTPDVAYEPLTIVLHEGNSYTSKTFVPVGVEIGNQEYWALSGNFNAQLENAILSLNDIKKSLNTIEKTYNNISFNFISGVVSGQSVIIDADKTIVMDFGGNSEPNFSSALNSLGIKHVDVGFISHYHNDHIDGLIDGVFDRVIDSSTVFYIANKPSDIMNENSSNTLLTNYNAVIAKIGELGASYMPAQGAPQIGVGSLTFYNYDNSYYDTISVDYNNCSVIAMYKNQYKSLLYMGDSTYVTWEHLDYNLPSADYLTAPHHGSSTVYGNRLFRTVDPQVCVTCIPSNSIQANYNAAFNSEAGYNGVPVVLTTDYPNNLYSIKLTDLTKKPDIIKGQPGGFITSWPYTISATSMMDLLKSFPGNSYFSLRLSNAYMSQALIAELNNPTAGFHLTGFKDSSGTIDATLTCVNDFYAVKYYCYANEYHVNGKAAISLRSDQTKEYIYNPTLLSFVENTTTLHLNQTGPDNGVLKITGSFYNNNATSPFTVAIGNRRIELSTASGKWGTATVLIPYNANVILNIPNGIGAMLEVEILGRPKAN